MWLRKRSCVFRAWRIRRRQQKG